MSVRVDADRAIRLVAKGATLLDVLPRRIYEQEHLPGAASLPLETFQPDQVGSLDRGRQVVVYCFDQHCDLSARAAARLEAEGFANVFDLIGGRATWTALGLPTEGTVGDRWRISNHLAPVNSVPFDATIADVLAMTPAPGTIRPEKRVDDVVRQLRDDSLDHVFVTTVGGALLGIARLGELDG